MTHQLIASPYPEGHVVVRPGYDGAVRIGAARYAELRDAPPAAPVPAWLTGPVRAGWGADLTGRLIRDTILVRPETPYGYARASYEVTSAATTTANTATSATRCSRAWTGPAGNGSCR